MELVKGETLEARVRRDGPMPFAVALEVVEQGARALAAAEACGVVHRDIKPSNIMLERDPGGCAPIVKVIDYGVAKVVASGDGTRRRPNSTRFHWNSGFRQSGTICQRWSNTHRYPRRYLFIRRDLLVSAFWPRSFCWPHVARAS